MTQNRTGTKAGRVCGVTAFTLLLALLLAVRFDFYYDLNDDTMIKDILSGAYTGTPSGYCMQMLYPLAWFLALCYRAIPTIPWYGLFLCLCQFGVFAFIAVRLVSVTKSIWARTAALAAETLLVLGLFLREFVVIQYSVTAGICMAGAVFLFLTTPKTQSASIFLRKNMLPLALVVLSFMIRTEVCIMLFPFLLLAGISKWCGEEKFFTGANAKKYLTLIGTALLCMMVAYSLDLLAYRGSDWNSFRSFFDARTKLYDFYGIPDYDDNLAFYESIGLSRESYMLLENYNFALDESINTWSLQAIVEYQEQLAKEGIGLCNTFGFVSKNSVKEAIWLYKNQILEDFKAIKNLTVQGGSDNGVVTHAAVVTAYLFYIAACILPAKGKTRAVSILKVIGLVVIRSILWLYLYMADRVLDRVTIPLLMLELVTIVGFLLSDIQNSRTYAERKRPRFIMLYVLCGLCMLCAAFALEGSLHRVQAEYDSRAAADRQWNALTDYCRKNGNNYYVIDVYSSTSYQGTPYSEKIFQNVDHSYKNFDICGGWEAKSPLARQKLAKSGLRDIQSALCSAKSGETAKAYFVIEAQRDIHWLSQYYEKRGIQIEPECVDQVAIFEIYELKRQSSLK